MNLQVIKNHVFKWIRKIIFYGIYLIFVVMLLGFALLQIPAVQKTIIGRLSDKYTHVTGFHITFKSIYVTWFDRLQIEGLLVTDPEQNIMIAADQLEVNFRLSNLVAGQDINLDEASLTGASVNLVKIQESDTSRELNINVLIQRLGQSGGGGGSGSKVNIESIAVNDSEFSYNDTDKDSLHHQFDYNHFRLLVDDVDAQQFNVIGDTIQFQVNRLTASDKATRFGISQLKTYFRISQSSMEFLNITLDAGRSHVTDTVRFFYNSQLDLSDFYNKVDIKATLRQTTIHPDDLAVFAPGVETIGQSFVLDGQFNGKVNRFFARGMKIKLGQTTFIGNLEMDGLPNINETFIDLKLEPSEINIADLRFIFSDQMYTRIKPLRTFTINGKFTGFINDFVANANFNGPIGKLKSDINLKIDESRIEQSRYKGSVELQDFDLGSFFGDTLLFQKVSLKGKINGKGFTEATADFLLNGVISSIGIRGYPYSNISTNARFRSQFFSGLLTIDDPNLQLRAEGSVDLRENHDLVKIKARLDTAFLDRLGMSREKLFIRLDADIDSKGLKIDSITGEALLRNAFVQYKEESLSLDSIHIISKQDKMNSLVLRSSVADVDMTGNYYYSTFFGDVENLFKELYLTIKNDRSVLEEYYMNKGKASQEYSAHFKVTLHDINPIVQLMNLPIEVSKGTSIYGDFTNGHTSIFSAYSDIDTVLIGGRLFTQNEIEFNGSKIRDSTNVLAMMVVQSAHQEFGKNLKTRNLLLEGIWNVDHVEVGLDLDQEGYNNQVRLKTEIDFLTDSTSIKVLPSRIQALDESWSVNPNNYAMWYDGTWALHNLEFINGTQSILLNGYISDQPEKILQLKVRDFDLSIVSTFAEGDFKGKLNGVAEGKDLMHNPYIQNHISVDDLTVDDFLIGDVSGVNEWNQNLRRFDINFAIDRLDERIIELAGYYEPTNLSPLQIDAHLKKANLKIVEPFLKDLFSQMDGLVTGNYTITGTFGEPKINGTAQITNGAIMVNYLRTLYSFNGTFGMSPDQLQFKDFELTDAFQHKATLEGFVAHRNFNEFRINIDAIFNNFQVLNTTSKDNSLFYGQGYATGNLNILGPASNLKISATAKTEKDTKIYIPISGAETIEKKEFINFVNFTDSASNTVSAETKTKEKRASSGISMDLNLDITPDAYAEIIFDIKAGDIIRGRGNGDIKLQLDTKGEFNMFGIFEFTQGAYNFTLYDIINKEFDIQNGSRISWYGDPYQGVLDINARYRQLASLAPILSDQTPTVINDPQIRRKYQAEVVLKIEGQMLSPKISFDLNAVDLPSNIIVDSKPISLLFQFQAFKAKLDEQEMKRQVFSLIVLRRFSPPDAFNTSGSITNSVSELLSNQLSYWLTQVDQNLEVDFDLGTMDQTKFNAFQLRLSYSFLNGRLRVTRDGTISNQYQASNNISSIAGDWTVDYLLTPDGKFKIKMYSRSNYNQITSSLGTQNAVTTGVSLLHTQNFNEFKDLLRSSREKRIKELETTPTNTDSMEAANHNQ